MKLFISYSRIDAKQTANVIHEYLTKYGHHEVFIDTSNIPYGGDWNEVIQKEIAKCDIFIIIVTPSALYRSEVEKEVESAKNLKKKIIPCIAKDYVDEDEIKWELNRYQGFFFERDEKLAMDLHKMIKSDSKTLKINEVTTEIKKDDEIKKGYNFPVLEKENLTNTTLIQRYFERAKDFEFLEQYDSARDCYDKIIEKEPENFDAIYNKALCLDKLEAFEDAMKTLEVAINLVPKNADIWYH